MHGFPMADTCVCVCGGGLMVVVIVLLTERSHPARKNHYTGGKGGLRKNINKPINNFDN